MRICKIWDSDYPWDVRVEKICNSLISAGHEVHLVCRNIKKRRVYECINGLHVHRLPGFTASIGGVPSFPFFLNPVWLFAILKTVRKFKIDCIIVRDLPMALAGVIVGRLRRIPCFLDMAEPYPEMLEGYRKLQQLSLRKKLINLFVRNSHFAYMVEKLVCRQIAHIFPVSEEVRDNLIRKGVNESKITVLRNTPPLSFFNDTESHADDSIFDRQEDGLNVIYVGDLTEARGLPVAILAIDILHKMNEKFNLQIIGKGRYEKNLREMVRQKALENYIFFKGWVSHENLPKYFMSADIGIIPHVNSKHNDLTLPNKVFDVMAFGKPLVSANLAPIRRIVEETKSGLIFEDYTPECLAEVLLQLKDQELRLRIGENGRRAVRKIYHWERDFDNFMKTIFEIAAEPPLA